MFVLKNKKEYNHVCHMKAYLLTNLPFMRNMLSIKVSHSYKRSNLYNYKKKYDFISLKETWFTDIKTEWKKRIQYYYYKY